MKPLGKYGSLHRSQLEENRPALFEKLSEQDLESLCLQLEKEAQEMKARLLKNGADEPQAEELVLNELVLVPDEATATARQQGGYTD